MNTEIIQHTLEEIDLTWQKFLSAPDTVTDIARGAQLCADALKSGHKIISCGNGGSLCDATHFAEELTGRYRDSRRPLPALAINDPAYITCTANDFSFNEVFSRYVECMGMPGDVLLAISTSGKSENILKAAEQAHHNKMQVLVLTAVGDNPLTHLAEVSIRAPHAHHSDRIQEIHIKVIHTLIQLIEAELGPTF